MFNKLYTKYFWRGIYTDVVNFVRKCDKCSDLTMPLDNTVQEEEDSEEVEDSLLLSPSSATSLTMLSPKNTNINHIWKKVR